MTSDDLNGVALIASHAILHHPPHQVIMADTSFSDMKSPDCRGLAMNEVITILSLRLNCV